MSEKKKRTFIAYTDWIEYFDEDVTMEQRGMLFDAILRYQNGEEDVKPSDPVARVIFNKIKKTMEADHAKYAEICRKRAESGAAGGVAKASKCQQMVANGSKCTPDTETDTDTDTKTDTDTENVSPNGDKREKATTSPKRETASRFRPPTVEEVEAYCFERNNRVDPERFVDFYSSNGWKVGKNPMKDWKAAVRTWEKRDGPDNVVGLNSAQRMEAARNEVLDRIIGGVM